MMQGNIIIYILLIGILKYMKIGNAVIKWIHSYLSSRIQCTKIGSIVSNEQDINKGLPQGSFLGPLFFLCYINDITQICDNTNTLLHADDPVLYKLISDEERFLDMHNFNRM